MDPDVALPHVPGHEFAGTVIEVGHECRSFRKGDRVTAPFILACWLIRAGMQMFGKTPLDDAPCAHRDNQPRLR